MATITLEYDGRNVGFKKLIEAFIALGAKVKNEPAKQMSGIEKSLEDIKHGRVYKAKSVDDMMKRILA